MALIATVGVVKHCGGEEKMCASAKVKKMTYDC